MDTNMKKVTMDVIAIVVNWALLDKGVITTLEVKNYLRSKGYFALQSEISKLMEEYQADFEDSDFLLEIGDKLYTIDFRTAGNHKEYFLLEVEVDTVADLDDVSFVQATVAQPRNMNIVQAPSAITVLLDDPRAFIEKNMNMSSYDLAKILEISTASVRAYKANINR